MKEERMSGKYTYDYEVEVEYALEKREEDLLESIEEGGELEDYYEEQLRLVRRALKEFRKRQKEK